MADDPDKDRAVGVEIEFAGLDTHRAAEIVARALSGEVEVEGMHQALVTGTALGDIGFELDTRYAKPPSEKSGFVDRALERIGARNDAVNLLSTVVPVELITEPLRRDQFPALDEAVEALRAAGAQGTAAAPLYAFGMHLNVALTHGGAERAIRIAGAYSFAERWIRDRWPVDSSRRLVPFIDPYPKGWRVDLGEAMAAGIDLERFIRLYYTYNPSRNRALDLWPLLGHLAPDTVLAIRGRPVENARPAFHYRWPDSRVSEPGWSPWSELDRWILVERAADDPDALERIRAASVAVECGKGHLSTYMAVLGEVMA